MTAPIGMSRLDPAMRPMPTMPSPSAQLQQQVMSLARDRDLLATSLILLLRAIESGTTDALMRVDGKIALRIQGIDATRKAWVLNAEVNKAKSSDPTVPVEDVIIFTVAEKPPAPTLVVPK